ncbi:MAG: amidohydrolase [Parvibaculaceae bacterium]
MDRLAHFLRGNVDRWTSLRRDLHRHPELGFTEFRTISMLAARLERLGFAVKLGREVMDPASIAGLPPEEIRAQALQRACGLGAEPRHVERMAGGLTGMVAEMRRGKGPVVAMRFDVDALAVSESAEEAHKPVRAGFASLHDGIMHACGHDAHAAIGLALAEAVAAGQVPWRGTLRLIFQPAEESGRGARPMAEAGIVDDAEWFFALHIGCGLPSGEAAAMASGMLFSSKWDVTFTGRAAHAAGNPEAGCNALLAAAQAALALHALPRHGRHATHVNVGRLVAGSARNVIPARAQFEMELRGECREALDCMERLGRDAIAGAAAIHGCACDIAPSSATIGAKSTVQATQVVRSAAAQVSAIHRIHDSWPLGGGDDAAYFMQRISERGGEACYFILGSDMPADHHCNNFDIDENTLPSGAEILARALCAVTGGAELES